MSDSRSCSNNGRLIRAAAAWCLALAALSGCATFPGESKAQKPFKFPKNAFIGDVGRPYTVLGPVRSRVDYASLDAFREERDLCRNYYNKAVRDLVKYAKQQGADAVIDVKSVTFLIDGRTELHAEPECSDEGGEGQILTQGIAVKWKGGPVESGAWATPDAPSPAAKKAQAERENRLAEAAEIQSEAAARSVAASASEPGRATSGTTSGIGSLMPRMPEGGQLVPDATEEELLGAGSALTEPVAGADARPAGVDAGHVSADSGMSAPSGSGAQSMSVQPATIQPVTVRMEPYDPHKSLLSTPGPSVATAPMGSASEPVPQSREPAAQAPVRTQAKASEPRLAPSLPLADPRNIPGTLRRPRR